MPRPIFNTDHSLLVLLSFNMIMKFDLFRFGPDAVYIDITFSCTRMYFKAIFYYRASKYSAEPKLWSRFGQGILLHNFDFAIFT